MLQGTMSHQSDSQGVVVEYNTIIKSFPDGTKYLKYTSYSNLKGLLKTVVHNGTSSTKDLERYNEINLSRRRQSISDLIYANGCIKPWEYFITLTFDDEFVESGYSHENVTQYLSRWLNNQRKLNPSMRYILVPELHESGRIHFHGVFSDVPKWELIQATNFHTGKTIIKNGSIIYNLANYDLGFTTVSKIVSLEGVSRYITKYITKDLLNLKNKKNVWHSRNLIKPKESLYLCEKSDIYNFLSNKNISYIHENNTDTFTSLFVKIKDKN